jgi:hypothetical protein
MFTKKKTTTAAAATKEWGGGNHFRLEQVKVSVSTPKAPVFTYYSTKVQDLVLIRPVWVDDQQYVEFDMSLAAALMCGDGIQAVLAPDGMSLSLQRGVYSSFFTNRRYRKDQGKKYSKDSSSVTSHRKVCDEFKKKESVQNGIVYGECQVVLLPCECTGLVEEIFTGRVQTPITHSPSLRKRMVWTSRRNKSTFNSW